MATDIEYRFVSLGEPVEVKQISGGTHTYSVEDLAYTAAANALVSAPVSDDTRVIAVTAVRGALRALMENGVVLAAVSDQESGPDLAGFVGWLLDQASVCVDDRFPAPVTFSFGADWIEVPEKFHGIVRDHNDRVGSLS